LTEVVDAKTRALCASGRAKINHAAIRVKERALCAGSVLCNTGDLAAVIDSAGIAEHAAKRTQVGYLIQDFGPKIALPS
jgi:hypothetical protein